MFLAADARRYEELDDAVREYLAWTELAGTEDRIRELELPPQQAAQAAQAARGGRRTVDLRISATYHWLLVPVQTTSSPLRIDELKADTNKDRLAERASERLKNADMLRVVQGPQNIRLDLDQHLSSVWAVRPHRGRQAVGVLLPVPLPAPARRPVGAGERHPGRLRPGDLGPDGFAVASGYDDSSGQYIGLRDPP